MTNFVCRMEELGNRTVSEFCNDLIDKWSDKCQYDCNDLCKMFLENHDPLFFSPSKFDNFFEMLRVYQCARRDIGIEKKLFPKDWTKQHLTGMKIKKRLYVSLGYIEINKWVDVVKTMCPDSDSDSEE